MEAMFITLGGIALTIDLEMYQHRYYEDGGYGRRCDISKAMAQVGITGGGDTGIRLCGPVPTDEEIRESLMDVWIGPGGTPAEVQRHQQAIFNEAFPGFWGIGYATPPDPEQYANIEWRVEQPIEPEALGQIMRWLDERVGIDWKAGE